MRGKEIEKDEAEATMKENRIRKQAKTKSLNNAI